MAENPWPWRSGNPPLKRHIDQVLRDDSLPHASGSASPIAPSPAPDPMNTQSSRKRVRGAAPDSMDASSPSVHQNTAYPAGPSGHAPFQVAPAGLSLPTRNALAPQSAGSRPVAPPADPSERMRRSLERSSAFDNCISVLRNDNNLPQPIPSASYTPALYAHNNSHDNQSNQSNDRNHYNPGYHNASRWPFHPDFDMNRDYVPDTEHLGPQFTWRPYATQPRHDTTMAEYSESYRGSPTSDRSSISSSSEVSAYYSASSYSPPSNILSPGPPLRFHSALSTLSGLDINDDHLAAPMLIQGTSENSTTMTEGSQISGTEDTPRQEGLIHPAPQPVFEYRRNHYPATMDIFGASSPSSQSNAVQPSAPGAVQNTHLRVLPGNTQWLQNAQQTNAQGVPVPQLPGRSAAPAPAETRLTAPQLNDTQRTASQGVEGGNTNTSAGSTFSSNSNSSLAPNAVQTTANPEIQINRTRAVPQGHAPPAVVAAGGRRPGPYDHLPSAPRERTFAITTDSQGRVLDRVELDRNPYADDPEYVRRRERFFREHVLALDQRDGRPLAGRRLPNNNDVPITPTTQPFQHPLAPPRQIPVQARPSAQQTPRVREPNWVRRDIPDQLQQLPPAPYVGERVPPSARHVPINNPSPLGANFPVTPNVPRPPGALMLDPGITDVNAIPPRPIPAIVPGAPPNPAGDDDPSIQRAGVRRLHLNLRALRPPQGLSSNLSRAGPLTPSQPPSSNPPQATPPNPNPHLPQSQYPQVNLESFRDGPFRASIARTLELHNRRTAEPNNTNRPQPGLRVPPAPDRGGRGRFGVRHVEPMPTPNYNQTYRFTRRLPLPLPPPATETSSPERDAEMRERERERRRRNAPTPRLLTDDPGVDADGLNESMARRRALNRPDGSEDLPPHERRRVPWTRQPRGNPEPSSAPASDSSDSGDRAGDNPVERMTPVDNTTGSGRLQPSGNPRGRYAAVPYEPPPFASTRWVRPPSPDQHNRPEQVRHGDARMPVVHPRAVADNGHGTAGRGRIRVTVRRNPNLTWEWAETDPLTDLLDGIEDMEDELLIPDFGRAAAAIMVIDRGRQQRVPQQVIDTLPSAVYSDWATEETEDCCPICLDDYEPTAEVLKIPACKHFFHKKCLSEWFARADTCPKCRTTITRPHQARPPNNRNNRNNRPTRRDALPPSDPPPPAAGPSGQQGT